MINFNELKINGPDDAAFVNKWNGIVDHIEKYQMDRVGIGTTAPKAGLHVAGEGADGMIWVERSEKSLVLNPNYGGKNQFAHISTTVGSNMGLKFDTNEKTNLTILTNGHVGIGTTNPKRRLTIQSQRPRVALVENGGNAGVMEFDERDDNLKLQWWDQGGGRFRRNLMVLGINGKVGIGMNTSNPSHDLTVSARRPRIALLEHGGNAGVIEYHEGADQLKFQWWDRSGARHRRDILTLGINGNVGIGTNTMPDTLTLRSNGTFGMGPWYFKQTGGGSVTSYLRLHRRTTGKVNEMFRIDWSGNFKARGYVQGSDQRIKKDIQPFTDGLTIIEKMKPVSFKFNGLGGTIKGKEDWGFIAQDLQKIAPYLTSTYKDKLHPNDKKERELLDIHPIRIIPLLVNAVQELSQQLKELKYDIQLRPIL